MTRTFLLSMLGLVLIIPCACRNDGNTDTDTSRIDHFIMKMEQAGKTPNRLIKEKSPYLLQHAFNPVDWYPWGDEAFQKARNEKKPIFLSIGYSTCHWCHVMERESFESDSIAALMNEFFICIKLDREERPDVDKIYMAALQGMGQGGGWPMSMFLTPDLRPFYGGTYFPPESRYGRIGFPDLLRRIHTLWTTQNEKVLESAAGLTDFLRQVAERTDISTLNPDVADTCFAQIARTYDPTHGGFGQGPKFPRPVTHNFLLRYYLRTGNKDALNMVKHTLTKMAAGGIADHLGGGFHRYSVDGEWRVPHFEKMLYDQAQLACSFLELYQVDRHESHARVAKNILDYVLRDMRDPSGGFYSAEDADSQDPANPDEKSEGAFYVWTDKDINDLIPSDDRVIVTETFGVKAEGNALADPQGEFSGKNILYAARTAEDLAIQLGSTAAEIAERLAASRETLFRERNKRPRPHLDDKILTAWNGMMISALARGYQVLGERQYLSAAEGAAGWVVEHLFDADREILFRRYRDGEASFDGNLDDYAQMVQGLLDLYEASFDIEWLDRAVVLTQRMIDLFHDPERGGFFDTSGGSTDLLVRMKETYDGAEPAGNSVAVLVLLRLADMTDNEHWRRLAGEALSGVAYVLNTQPAVMPQMVVAWDLFMHGSTQIILVGSRNHEAMTKLRSVAYGPLLPGRIILHAEPPGPDAPIARFLPFAATLPGIDGKPTVYVCEGFVCRLPTTDPEEFGKLLHERTIHRD